jgi:hypothetical protein
MKRYMADAADLMTQAANAAQLPDTDRHTALSSVFEHAGHLAYDYADPAGVLQLLVTEAANSYHDALNARRLAGRI